MMLFFWDVIKEDAKKIDDLYIFLTKLGLRCKFMVFGSTSDIKDIRQEDYVKYIDYISDVVKTNCIIELLPIDDYSQVPEGKPDKTLRSLEALFLNKKLITDNQEFVNSDVYDSNNTFILGKGLYKKVFACKRLLTSKIIN